jgi:hypothetical protein
MEIKDYLHLYYGAQCQISNCREIMIEQGFEDGISYINGDILGFVEMDDCQVKLILRPLSDMTEKEASEVYMIERDGLLHHSVLAFDVRKSDKAWRVTRLDDFKQYLFIGYSGRIWKVIEDEETQLDVLNHQPRIYAYLLSKGFDLFGLIEAGLAIDKTK